MAGKIRRKNNILSQAGKNIKKMVEQHLVRKAAIDTIEQRHLLDISGINLMDKIRDDVNSVGNPGFEEI